MIIITLIIYCCYAIIIVLYIATSALSSYPKEEKGLARLHTGAAHPRPGSSINKRRTRAPLRLTHPNKSRCHQCLLPLQAAFVGFAKTLRNFRRRKQELESNDLSIEERRCDGAVQHSKGNTAARCSARGLNGNVKAMIALFPMLDLERDAAVERMNMSTCYWCLNVCTLGRINVIHCIEGRCVYVYMHSSIHAHIYIHIHIYNMIYNPFGYILGIPYHLTK